MPASEPVHFLQIWIIPERAGLAPGCPDTERRGRLRLIGSRDARDGSVRIQQDVDLYAMLLDRDDRVSHAVRPGRVS